MKTTFSLKQIVPILLAFWLIVGCNANRTTKGGLIGAGAGGAIGGVIGAKTGSTAAGAIIGATVGGAAGAIIGRYMDKQAAELDKDLENATVERVGEGIKVTFESGILFAFDSDKLTPEAEANVGDLAKTLQKYEDTEVLIEGHTDNKGTTQYNKRLSERRAKSVEQKLQALGVKGARVTTKGYGFDQPVASNDTEAGRAQNRRVEVAIYANEDLKKQAKNGELTVR